MHRRRNTLDLVVTFAGRQSDTVTVDPAGVISDHAPVVCRLGVTASSPTIAE